MLTLTGLLGAAEVWTVPVERHDIAFTVPAVVDIDRSATTLILPTARDLIATWVVPHGSYVRRGDPIIVFDATLQRNRVRERRNELTVAEATARLGELRLETEGRDLEDQRQQLVSDLAVAEAALARAGRPDPEQEAVLAAEVERAKADLAYRRRLRDAARVSFALGEIIGDTLATAELDLAAAEATLSLAEAALAEERGSDRGLALQRAAARVEDLRVRLGVDADGKAVVGAGIAGRIEAFQAKSRRDQRRFAEDRDRALRDLHEALRDAFDHTPVRAITVGDRDFRFTEQAGDGQIAVGLEVYDAQRGWGFVAAPKPTTQVVKAQGGGSRRGGGGGRPPGGGGGGPGGGARAWGGGGGGGGAPAAGGGGGSGGSASTLLVRGEERWRLDLPAGTHDLTVTLGDSQDWDGAVVFVEDADGRRCLASHRRIDAGRDQVATASVRSDGSGIILVFGDTHPKALRAGDDGIALPREWIEPGWRPGWLQDPAAFLAGPGSLRLRAVVHQDQGRLLRGRNDDLNETPELADRLAVGEVAWRAADGRSGRAEVSNVVRIAVPLGLREDALGDGPLDRLGNEVFFTMDRIPASDEVRIGTSVEVTITIPVPEDCTAVPAHLVGRSGERHYLQLAGEDPSACRSVRVDGFHVVDRLLEAGSELVVVDLDRADAQEQRFPGEIVAGTSYPVICPTATGRIAELIPDGSRVEAGDIVVKLYSPWIEERREENARRLDRAQQSYEESAESRRVAAERAAVEHRARVIAEEIARIDAAMAAEPDPLAVARAEVAVQQAVAAESLARDILVRARAAGDPRQLENAERRAATAVTEVERARLDLAAARRAVDHLAVAEQVMVWQDALADLDSREIDRREAKIQERASALTAELQLADALQGNRWERAFNLGKDLKAPKSGRLFYRKGWDDRANREATFQRDFWVWRGMTVADVLDTGDLAFEVDLPEGRVRELKPGQQVEVVLTRFDLRRLPATIETIGRAVLPAADDDAIGVERRLGLRRVVRVRCAFTVPADLRERLVPGDKAELDLP